MGLAPHVDDAPVCVGVGQRWTRADLARDVGAAVAALGPARPGSARLVVCRSRYAFVVGLLACWERGELALLPANLSDGALEEVAAQAVSVLHDGGDGSQEGLDLGAVIGTPASPARLDRPDDDAVLVRLSTSGSTGAFRFFDKRAHQILGEPEVLASTFDIGPGVQVLATIPPHHIYGLLFSVLMPLLRGAAFVDDSPMFPSTIAARLRATGSRVLVTVPAHLRVIAEAGLEAFCGLDRVFSSGAPLPARTARSLAAAYELDVTEVFGSTETGGIAWRQRLVDPVWQTLPGVEVDEGDGGRLQLRSPFLPRGAPQPWPADDRIALRAPGRFEHLGRLDDVVKIASKRVSMGAVEQALLDVPGVLDCAVVAVTAPGGRATLRAAVVAPDADPVALRSSLVHRLDCVAVPKLVLVDALPRGANGKLRRQAVLGLVGAPAGGLVVTETLRVDHRYEAEVRVPEDARWFDGHFEERPILPGVVQLQLLVVTEARRVWSALGPCIGAPQVRFREAIGPSDVLSLVLDADLEVRSVRFSLSRQGQRCTTGVLRFAEPGSGG